MTRKSKHAAKALPRATRSPSATHKDLQSLIAGKQPTTMKNPRKAGSANPKQTEPGSPGYGSSAASVTSSNDNVEGSDNDGAEADQDADDDDDGDELAPSDTVIASNVDQTGHNVGMGLKLKASTGKGRRHSPSNAATKKQQARRHKSSKSTSHEEGQNAETDDDDYNGVDLISDSEGEEPTVEQLEEKVIIESEEEYNCSTPPKLPSISDDGYTGFEGFDLQGDLFLSDVPYFDEQIGRTDPHILAEEIAIFNSTDFSQNFYDVELPPRLTPPRRVRFAEDVPDLDKSSAIVSDTERNGSGSPWVASEEEGAASGNREAEDEDNDSSSGRSSGYESGYCVIGVTNLVMLTVFAFSRSWGDDRGRRCSCICNNTTTSTSPSHIYVVSPRGLSSNTNAKKEAPSHSSGLSLGPTHGFMDCRPHKTYGNRGQYWHQVGNIPSPASKATKAVLCITW